MIIVKIKPGSKSFCEFRGRLLYAEVRGVKDNLICSATLEFILRTYFDKQNEISNYREALMEYIDFNNKIAHLNPQKPLQDKDETYRLDPSATPELHLYSEGEIRQMAQEESVKLLKKLIATGRPIADVLQDEYFKSGKPRTI